ncbi:hypothetical protein [Bacillus sp. 3255]|uniref:hypothetical protein n=1 Tax=Bacillus sp. 3255 TaxID=2817904 RepID=UPI00285AAD57|nr:hypothetical protein [Bacillus sp. 3255]MDR6883028.1 hypothetical protein [Bacillus sp. 3255]
MKVNNGHSFIHPHSGLIVGPGDIYHLETDQPETPAAAEVTLDEFKELKAPEQKDLLQGLGIEAGSKEPDRIAQYEEWLSRDQQQDPASNPDNTGQKGAAGDGSNDPANSSADGDQ